MPLSIIALYGVVTLTGWLWLPLVGRLLPATADRGAGVVKSLALVLAGYVAWWLAVVGVAGQASFWGGVVLVALVGLVSWLRWRHETWAWLRDTWRMLLFIELVGLVMYGGLLFFRGYTADITTIEKYTNMAIVNSIALTPQVPPPNAWFGGRPLNYYYFGHWTLTMLSQVSGLDTNDLVIVATPLLAALCAQCCITIVTTLVPGRGAGWSLVSIGLLLLCGSFNEMVHGLTHWRDEWQRTFFESRITPAIVDALAPYGNLFEVPAVSLLWGDFHAHFLGIPLMLVLVALFTHRMVYSSSALAAPGWYAACAVLLGCSYATNSWQYPTFLTFWLVLVWWRWLRWRGASVWVPLTESLLMIPASLVAVLPFLLTFESFAVVPPADSPLQPVPLLPGALLVWSPVGTTLRGLLLSIGLVLLLAGLAGLALVQRRGWRWVAGALLLGIVTGFYRPAGLVLIPLVGVGGWLAFCGRRGADAGGLMLLVGALVLLGCEYVMLPDHSLSRSNTIFKFYIQVWVLLALAGPVLLAFVWDNAGQMGTWQRERRLFAFGLLVLVLFSGAVFPILRGRQWLRYHGDHWWGLHGMAQVEAYQPDEAAAVAWLRAQPGRGGVLETIDNSSNGTDQRIRPARFSSLTGRPTPIGWMGHTAQWNNYTTSAENRERYQNSVALVHGFSHTGAITDVYALMAVNNLEYVAFGTFEAQSWGTAGRALLAENLPLRWQSGAVQVYGRPTDFPETLIWLPPVDWSDVEESTDGRGTRFHWMLGQQGEIALFSARRALVRVMFEPVNTTESGHLELWQNEHRLLEMDVVPYQSQPRALWLQVEPGVTTLEVRTTITPLHAAERSVTLAIAPPQVISILSISLHEREEHR